MSKCRSLSPLKLHFLVVWDWRRLNLGISIYAHPQNNLIGLYRFELPVTAIWLLRNILPVLPMSTYIRQHTPTQTQCIGASLFKMIPICAISLQHKVAHTYTHMHTHIYTYTKRMYVFICVFIIKAAYQYKDIDRC